MTKKAIQTGEINIFNWMEHAPAPKPGDETVLETVTEIEVKKVTQKHPDAILLFRVGDFYELFGEDAQEAFKILGLNLTTRANGKADKIYLAGFPHHALDTYLPKLVRAGRRVAICEQLEDPMATKKLVKRGIQ